MSVKTRGFASVYSIQTVKRGAGGIDEEDKFLESDSCFTCLNILPVFLHRALALRRALPLATLNIAISLVKSQ